MMKALKMTALIGMMALTLNAHAGRMLVDQPAYQVNLIDAMHCGAPVAVEIMSRNNGLFTADSNELQRLVDGLRAMLGYECPSLAEIRLQGRRPGETGWIYRGKAQSANQWLVESEIASNAYSMQDLPLIKPSIEPEVEFSEKYTQSAQASTPTAVEENDYAVLGLKPGMSLYEVKTVLQKRFTDEPRYDAAKRTLFAQSGGCPSEFDWTQADNEIQPGWQCVTAVFTPGNVQTLKEVHYVQTTAQNQSNQAVDVLRSRFGEPIWQTSYRRGNAVWQILDKPVTRLAWGDTLPVVANQPVGEQNRVYQLEADVEDAKSATVVALILRNPNPEQSIANKSLDKQRLDNLAQSSLQF